MSSTFHQLHESFPKNRDARSATCPHREPSCLQAGELHEREVPETGRAFRNGNRQPRGTADEDQFQAECGGTLAIQGAGNKTWERVESVRDVLGEDTVLTGFYSYGEICPSSPQADCELHNQTMTVTTFRELDD